MAPGFNLQPLTRGVWGGGCYPQIHNFRTFQLRSTRWISQNFDWMCLGKNTLCPHCFLLRQLYNAAYGLSEPSLEK